MGGDYQWTQEDARALTDAGYMPSTCGSARIRVEAET
jgi:hypothetical protein